MRKLNQRLLLLLIPLVASVPFMKPIPTDSLTMDEVWGMPGQLFNAISGDREEEGADDPRSLNYCDYSCQTRQRLRKMGVEVTGSVQPLTPKQAELLIVNLQYPQSLAAIESRVGRASGSSPDWRYDFYPMPEENGQLLAMEYNASNRAVGVTFR